MTSDGPSTVVKENTTVATESSGDKEANKEEKVRVIHCMYLLQYQSIERRWGRKWRRQRKGKTKYRQRMDRSTLFMDTNTRRDRCKSFLSLIISTFYSKTSYVFQSTSTLVSNPKMLLSNSIVRYVNVRMTLLGMHNSFSSSIYLWVYVVIHQLSMEKPLPSWKSKTRGGR